MPKKTQKAKEVDDFLNEMVEKTKQEQVELAAKNEELNKQRLELEAQILSKTNPTPEEQGIIDAIKTRANNKTASGENMKTVEELTKIADGMWKKLKEVVKADKSFEKSDDKVKLEYFRVNLNYKEFMTEFPIVARYMICMGQYSSKAYARFLEKIRITVHPPPDQREKGYMEDQWVRRQADYVRYLWESYQKGHYNQLEAQAVWQDVYKKLKGEFDDFRDKYKAIEESTKEEKKALAASNAKDLIDRLKTGTQTLGELDTKRLLHILKDKLYKRRFSNTMGQIKTDVPPVEPTCESIGAGAADTDVKSDPDKPTIRMIEHVDSNRINEVPENMKLDEKTAKEIGYHGMSSIQE